MHLVCELSGLLSNVHFYRIFVNLDVQIREGDTEPILVSMYITKLLSDTWYLRHM